MQVRWGRLALEEPLRVYWAPLFLQHDDRPLGARQGHVVIGDNMAALSGDYHPVQAITANHNRQAQYYIHACKPYAANVHTVCRGRCIHVCRHEQNIADNAE